MKLARPDAERYVDKRLREIQQAIDRNTFAVSAPDPRFRVN
jgi:hypothetical protein